MCGFKERIKLLKMKVKTGCKHAKRELKELLELVDKIDADGNGRITKKEHKQHKAVISDDLETR